MARLEWIIIAQGSSVDQTANVLSIFNIIEEMNVPEAALAEAKKSAMGVSVGPPFVCICKFLRTDPQKEESVHAILQIKAPNGAIVSQGEMRLDLTGPFVRGRAALNVQALPVTAPGIYEFAVMQKEGDALTQIGRTEVTVNPWRVPSP